ncbi:GNAT family N-acetyltransferase [Hymenobacter metallicola]|uniref:GNAT family N-acetyltransferase n=1 Tax=Hymenobacter metallicola TaxID=2563114 RepID=UPI0014366E6E|nr:GNAT family N-acetyltransferase [Hymenobacter metallicola]
MSLAAAACNSLAAVDDKRIYTVALLGKEKQPTSVQPASEAHPKLVALAVQSGVYSRFRTDKRFAAGAYEQLYTQWLDKALTGAPTQQVLIYPAGSAAEAQGLLTLERREGTIQIGLLAVDTEWRRRGIGQQLLNAAKREAYAAGFSTLQVTTQGANAAACRLYEQNGFTLHQRHYVFHIWLPQEE